MGAAQNQGVDARGLQRLQVLLCHRLDDHVSPLDASVFHQGYEQRAGLADDLHVWVQPPERGLVGAGANRGQGGDDAHPLVFRHQQGTAAGRLHHAHDGQVVFRLEGVQRCGGHGAAGDEDGFQVKGPQKPHILPGVFQQRLLGAAAVGHPGGIPEIDEVFLRQNLPQGAHRRQAAEAGVEYADRPCIHGRSSF